MIDKYSLSCEYSQKIVSMLTSDKYFKKYNTASATSKEALSQYFTTEFTEEYICFVDDIVVEFYNKLKQQKK